MELGRTEGGDGNIHTNWLGPIHISAMLQKTCMYSQSGDPLVPVSTTNHNPLSLWDQDEETHFPLRRLHFQVLLGHPLGGLSTCIGPSLQGSRKIGALNSRRRPPVPAAPVAWAAALPRRRRPSAASRAAPY